MKLTEKEKKQVITAINNVEAGIYVASCYALSQAGGYKLRNKYADFYGKSSHQRWFTGKAYDFATVKRFRNVRVLMLTNFLVRG